MPNPASFTTDSQDRIPMFTELVKLHTTLGLDDDWGYLSKDFLDVMTWCLHRLQTDGHRQTGWFIRIALPTHTCTGPNDPRRAAC
ncbi:hypothetical protein IAR50_005022 [Cryptococcus sp. DSM 104548]